MRWFLIRNSENSINTAILYKCELRAARCLMGSSRRFLLNFHFAVILNLLFYKYVGKMEFKKYLPLVKAILRKHNFQENLIKT